MFRLNNFQSIKLNIELSTSNSQGPSSISPGATRSRNNLIHSPGATRSRNNLIHSPGATRSRNNLIHSPGATRSRTRTKVSAIRVRLGVAPCRNKNEKSGQNTQTHTLFPLLNIIWKRILLMFLLPLFEL